MRVYIAGPITGVENYKDNFEYAEKKLIRAGHKPVNPVKICSSIGENAKHEVYMKKLIPFLCDCDGIFCLEGWQESKGASFEVEVAAKCGIPMVEVTVLSKEW